MQRRADRLQRGRAEVLHNGRGCGILLARYAVRHPNRVEFRADILCARTILSVLPPILALLSDFSQVFFSLKIERQGTQGFLHELTEPDS